MPTETTDRFIEIGVVGRPHGLDGEMRVFLHNPESDILSSCRGGIHLGTEHGLVHRNIAHVRPATGHLLCQLQEVSSREEAERLKGSRIYVIREDLPELDPGEFYVADLIGLQAMDGDVSLGRISSSRHQAGIEVVTVTGTSEEVEIPLVEDYVVAIEIQRGRVIFRGTEDLPRTAVEHGRKRGR